MRRRVIAIQAASFAVCAAAVMVVLRAQTPAGVPVRIERLTPALDEIVSVDARIETLGDRFTLTEGALWVPPGAAGNDGPDGYLLFSDNAANVIYKWAPNRPLSVFLEKRGLWEPTTPKSARKRSRAASESS
jgi:gluconolactonase